MRNWNEFSKLTKYMYINCCKYTDFCVCPPGPVLIMSIWSFFEEDLEWSEQKGSEETSNKMQWVKTAFHWIGTSCPAYTLSINRARIVSERCGTPSLFWKLMYQKLITWNWSYKCVNKWWEFYSTCINFACLHFFSF